MTCIAWDGKTLAADKRATYQGLTRTVTKIFRHGNALLAIAGDGGMGMEMVNWIRGGGVLSSYPPTQREEKTMVYFAMIEDGRVWMYERTPHPLILEDRQFAMGSGRDFALAAMHLGKSAREAVEIACLFEQNCGNGVDVLELEREDTA